MGQQTSPDTERTRLRHRVRSTSFATVSVVVAVLAVSSMIWWASSSAAGRTVSAGTQADSAHMTTSGGFDNRDTAPVPQVGSTTVFNLGDAPITIAGSTIQADTTPEQNPWQVYPGEDCSGVTLAPNGFCVVSVEYTNKGTQAGDRAQLVVTMQDGSTITGTLNATDDWLNSPVSDSYVVSFGGHHVGEAAPTQQITLGSSPGLSPYQIMGLTLVDNQGTPGGHADYSIASDGCTGVDLRGASGEGGGDDSCVISVANTPTAVGHRPAYLNVMYCYPGYFAHTTNGDDEPPVPVPGQELVCGRPDGPQFARNMLISLDGSGVATSVATTPPTSPTTPVKPGQKFTPKLVASPPLVPAGRTTQVSATGFPPSVKVTFALVPLGTAPTVNLAQVPGVTTAQANGTGAFTSQVMVVMPHTPAGSYEILATTTFAGAQIVATLPFTVSPGTLQPPQFVIRH